MPGLSVAAQARVLRKVDEIAWAKSRLLARFSKMRAFGKADGFLDYAFIEILPQVVSVLDCSKDVGNTELIKVPLRAQAITIGSRAPVLIWRQ